MRDKSIADYKLVKGIDTTALTDTVKANMKEGWEPYGASYYGVRGYFYQTMVKYHIYQSVPN